MQTEEKFRTMTEGEIWQQILYFSIPLLIGNLFQQLYNTVDSVVVGQFIGDDALAAVGSSASLISLIIGLFVGIATGAGVLIAQYYGARFEEKLHLAVHTAMCISIIGGVVLTVIGITCSKTLLEFMGTPEAVMPKSTVYLRIFFLGSVVNLVYNMGAGILRAVGDSKSPLYYLILASVVNIVLDILFVVVLGLGVAGVGLATIIAQGVSCVCVVSKLLHSRGAYRIEVKKIRIDKQMLGRIIQFGVPSGIQGCIISLSNVVVQANINRFGKVVMAGCSSYSKIDGFVLLPVMSFSMAIMTFVGQNVGAGKYNRVKKGVYITAIMSGIYVVITSFLLLLFGKHMLGIFSKERETIQYGLVMLKILLPFYVTISLVNVLTGAFRGAGKAMVSMIIMIVNLCGVRMLWVAIMTPRIPKIETVLWGYPVSWVTGILCCLFYAYKGNWLKQKSDGL